MDAHARTHRVPIDLYTEERIAEFVRDEDEVAKLFPPPEGA
jgi:hypothetical protein